MQMRVLGLQYGTWGMQRYGAKPQKQDALEFYVEHIRALLPHIQAQQAACKADPNRILPTAFVTFKTRRAQVCTDTKIRWSCQRLRCKQSAAMSWSLLAEQCMKLCLGR